MDGKSLDITAEKLAQLRAIFPEVFSEDKVDFARLKDVLGESVDFPNEHYELSWAGKAEARKEIQNQTADTLIPDKESSVNFGATGNIFIEGENLEVLRVLQKSYFGKVKMIYIDPPYNTGNDSFVYPDDYAERQDEYNKRTGKTNGEGYLNKQDLWRKNTRENGQFHSVWLSMMYPRLYLARNLLQEEGVIFVSVDYNEISNLLLLMNEIFGEENFLGCVVRATGTTTGQDATKFGSSFDYCLAYRKSEKFDLRGLPLSEKDKKRFSNDDNDGKGKYALLQLRKTGNADRKEDRESMFFPVIAPDNNKIYPVGPGGYMSRWRMGKSKYEEYLTNGMIVWKKVDEAIVDETADELDDEIEEIITDENGDKNGGISEGEIAINNTYIPYVKYHLKGRTKRPSSLWTDIEGNKKGSIELKELFQVPKVFDNPKPTDFIRKLLLISCQKNDLVLDFFAGSGSLAQAALELNETDGGTRRFVLVQIPELLEEKSQAYKAGYRTIADICKARIQKVIAKLQTARAAELALNGNQQPLGFQAFRLAPSNFKQWRGDVTSEDILKQLELHIHSEKENSEVEKMLYELLLKAGYPLTAKVELAEIDGQAVYTVEDGKLLVFFDDYTSAINTYVHQQKPQRVVCLDRVFKGNDEALTNFKLQLKEAGIDLTII
jgi:adenine-specific DNA-methyltransferase